MQHSGSPNSDGFKTWVQKALWHGGSRYDAWFNAVSGQVPTSFSSEVLIDLY